MPYSTLRKVRVLSGDPAGVFAPGNADLQDLLDRGSRDIARRGLLYQKRESIALTANTRVYTLSTDHFQTYTMFRERYSASVRLLSQDAHVWWLTVSPTGILSLIDAAAPAGHVLLPTDAYWLRMASPDATLWFVYPSVTGVLLTSDVQPAVGTGNNLAIQLRDVFGTPWYLSVSNTGILSVSMSGSAVLTAPALNDHAMQRVEPESIQRIDPRTDTGIPERYALSAKLLYLHPTPDLAYQLIHMYFSDDGAMQPQSVQYLPVLFAAGMGLMRSSRLVASQQLLGMVRNDIDVMAQNLWPGSRDGLNQYRMPPQ